MVVSIYCIAKTDASASYSAINDYSCVSKSSSAKSPSKYPNKNSPIRLQKAATIIDYEVAGLVLRPKIIKSEMYTHVKYLCNSESLLNFPCHS